jgi:putative ABC transport system ATP-binding protein
MTQPSGAKQPVQLVPIDVAAVARLLELGSQSVGRAVSAQRCLQALDTPDTASSWMEYLGAGATGVGLRAIFTDARPSDVIQGLGPGTIAITRTGNGRWILVAPLGHARARVTVLQGTGDERVRVLSARRLDRLMGSESTSWVLLEPWLPLESISDRENPRFAQHPWSRTRAFLGLERRALWGVALYAVVIGASSLATPIAVQMLVNTLAFGAVLQPLAVLLVMLTAALSLAGFLKVLEVYVLEVVQRRVFVRTAEDFGRRLPNVSCKVLRSKNVPELVNRFFEIPKVQKSVASLFLDGLTLALQTLTGMLLLGFYHPFLLAFDLVLVFLLAGVFLLGRGGIATAGEESRLKYETGAWLQDLARVPSMFRGPRGAERAALRTGALCRDWLQARRSHFRVVLRQVIGGTTIFVIATIALLGIGGWLVLEEQLTLGQLIAAELVVANLTEGFTKIGKHMETSYGLVIGVGKIAKVVNLPNERRGGVRLEESSPRRIEVEDLAVTLDGHRVFHGIDFTLESRDRLRVCGGVASGKSVLLDVMNGIHDPSGGIWIDGTDLARISLHSWRAAVVLVRGVELVEGSVLDNLQFAGVGVREPEARALAHLLDLESAIDRLPGRFDATLQANGAPLSDVQIRRLMLVRALLTRPRLLLLDRALDGLGLPPERLSEVLQFTLGAKAPWIAMVVTDDPIVAQWCTAQLHLGPKENGA